MIGVDRAPFACRPDARYSSVMRPRQGTPVAQPWGWRGHVLAARVALVAAHGFCLAALPGCSQNQCPHQGDMKCQGAQPLWCQPNDSETIAGTYLDWMPYLPRPCPHYCVEAEGQVECSLTSAPVPECASDTNSCWEGNVVPCVGGFPVESYLGPDGPQCGVDAGGTCATTGDPTCAYCLLLSDKPLSRAGSGLRGGGRDLRRQFGISMQLRPSPRQARRLRQRRWCLRFGVGRQRMRPLDGGRPAVHLPGHSPGDHDCSAFADAGPGVVQLLRARAARGVLRRIPVASHPVRGVPSGHVSGLRRRGRRRRYGLSEAPCARNA